MFHNFFNSRARSRYLSFFLLSFSFLCSQPVQLSSQFCYFSFFLVLIRWSVCMSKSHKSLCVSFSRTDAGLCIYHYNNYYYSLRCFPTSVSWRSLTEVWVTTSLLKSPGLFSVFWAILTMLSVRWSSVRPPISNTSIIIHSLELFTSAITDGFSLKSEWQQVSSRLQDSS